MFFFWSKPSILVNWGALGLCYKDALVYQQLLYVKFKNPGD